MMAAIIANSNVLSTSKSSDPPLSSTKNRLKKKKKMEFSIKIKFLKIKGTSHLIAKMMKD
jgi:hypothetical protein